jgi:hypothetical protein
MISLYVLQLFALPGIWFLWVLTYQPTIQKALDRGPSSSDGWLLFKAAILPVIFWLILVFIGNGGLAWLL